jgi:hypothetical protein
MQYYWECLRPHVALDVSNTQFETAGKREIRV